MKKNEISEIFLSHPATNELLEKLGHPGETGILLEGLTGSAKSLVLATVHNKLQAVHLAILPEKEEAANARASVRFPIPIPATSLLLAGMKPKRRPDGSTSG